MKCFKAFDQHLNKKKRWVTRALEVFNQRFWVTRLNFKFVYIKHRESPLSSYEVPILKLILKLVDCSADSVVQRNYLSTVLSIPDSDS